MLEEFSGLRSSSLLFATFALYRTPTIQTAFCSARGLWSERAFPFPHSSWWHLITMCADHQHWLTIVTHVLSNNLGMLGGILSRLTGMWDETILTCVVTEAVHVCGNVIDLFILWQECKASVRFATVMRIQRDRATLWDEGGGKVASRHCWALAILQNLPRMLISRSLEWNLPRHPAGSAPNRFIYSHYKRRLPFNGTLK